MKKVSCIIHQKYLDDVVRSLHENGLMQIIDISRENNEIEDIKPGKADEETNILNEYEVRFSTLISILTEHKHKKTGLNALLHPEIFEKQTFDETSLDELYSYAESVILPIENMVRSQQKEYDELSDQIEKLKQYETQASWFTAFHFSLEDIGRSEFVLIKAGKTTSLPTLQHVLSEEKNITMEYQPLKVGKNPEWAVVLIGHIDESKKIERLIAEHIQEITLPKSVDTPKDAQKRYQQEIKKAEKRKKEIHKALQDIASHHLSQLLATREEIQLENVRRLLPAQCMATNETIIIQGWVLASKTETLQSELTHVSEDHIIIDSKTPKTNPDDPPTYLETPAWAESFKTLLSLFALPRYNELNPTIMMGIFFVLFFGIMLGDAGYGSIILILSVFAYIKFGKISPMIKNWGFLGIWLGLVTLIVGFLTYSIFGNLIHLLVLGDGTSYLYQFSILNIQFPIDSLKDPITILTVALILGLVHLNIGIVYGLIQAFQQKRYKEMLTEKLCWFPLQIGGGALIGYFILDWTISQPFFYLSSILIVIGLVQLIYASGPIGFFDITGYVGDWLSYARLLALGLATAGMALAFNVVSQLLGEMIPFIGVIVTALLLLVLHVVNLAISALGAGVHSLRLQYVEFFNRFYEGGGHEFTPFKINRKYTEKESDQTP
jgi:V/A-type H+/Na+-transporting ATPase subunit I